MSALAAAGEMGASGGAQKRPAALVPVSILLLVLESAPLGTLWHASDPFWQEPFEPDRLVMQSTCLLLVGLGKYTYPPVKHAPQPA